MSQWKMTDAGQLSYGLTATKAAYYHRSSGCGQCRYLEDFWEMHLKPLGTMRRIHSPSRNAIYLVSDDWPTEIPSRDLVASTCPPDIYSALSGHPGAKWGQTWTDQRVRSAIWKRNQFSPPTPS